MGMSREGNLGLEFLGANMSDMVNGFLFIISGPSAVGKTTVAQHMLEMRPSLRSIITCTTRAIRSNEEDGVHYYFLQKDEFLAKKNGGEFAEYSEVYGNYYGILQSEIAAKTQNCSDALVVVNWDGFHKIKQAIHKNVVGFFLAPPTLADLEARIRARGTDSEEIVQKRLAIAQEDIAHGRAFDYCVENRDIADTARKILDTIDKLKQSTQKNT
jgi:guanylate kinase